MTRQQKWAKRAHDDVLRRKAEPNTRQAYRTVALGAPILIRQSGLVQALAFWMTRSEAAAQEFAKDLATTLDSGAIENLVRRAHTAELPDYLALTRDAVEVAMWYRRFAQSELKEE